MGKNASCWSEVGGSPKTLHFFFFSSSLRFWTSFLFFSLTPSCVFCSFLLFLSSTICTCKAAGPLPPERRLLNRQPHIPDILRNPRAAASHTSRCHPRRGFHVPFCEDLALPRVLGHWDPDTPQKPDRPRSQSRKLQTRRQIPPSHTCKCDDNETRIVNCQDRREATVWVQLEDEDQPAKSAWERPKQGPPTSWHIQPSFSLEQGNSTSDQPLLRLIHILARSHYQML